MDKHSSCSVTCFGALLLGLCGSAITISVAQGEVQREVLADGVEHWFFNSTPASPPRFFQQFQEVYGVEMATNSLLPFGKSAALLVGISDYKHLLPVLPSVTNDLVNFREFLINKGSFDHVYVMSERVVNRDLIEKYIKSVLPRLVGLHGRILFYYSGHGADGGGNTGYMQFSESVEGEFFGTSVLPVKAVVDWSDEVPVKHLLCLLDCCASGLAFTSKAGGDSSARLLLNTLSGDGSRSVLTAGTSDEKTFALDIREAGGSGVFTRAFLSAFDRTNDNIEKRGLLTISEVFALTQKEVGYFSVSSGEGLHPRLWNMKVSQYRGTFVFLDPRVRRATLDAQQASILKIPLAAKGADVDKIASETGIIQLTSDITGSVFIDGESYGRIASGDTRQYFNQPLGKRRLELRGETSYKCEVEVIKGAVAPLVITTQSDRIQQSPFTTLADMPKGTLRIRSAGMDGDLFVDSFKVDYLIEGEELQINKLNVGKHQYTIRPRKGTNQISGEFTIENGVTTQIGMAPPAAPQNLRFIMNNR